MKLLRRNYTFLELYILSKSILKALFNLPKIVNLILVKISLFFRLEKSLGLPVNILVEPTASCNYNCVKCERFSDEHKDDGNFFVNKEMPFGLYRKVVDDLGKTLITLRLWYFGESLLHPKIFEMIEYAKKKNIFVALSSNLSLLSKDDAKRFIYSGLDYLIVSFDGASQETYKLYHGKDCYHQVLSNIKNLVKLKSSLKCLNPFIELQSVMLRENEKEMGEFKTVANKLGVNKLTYRKLDYKRINLKKVPGSQLSSMDDMLPENEDFYYGKRQNHKINFCCIPWEETIIRYSGLVIPCSEDIAQNYQMGRVFQKSSKTGNIQNYNYIKFKKIWNNCNYQKYRKLMHSDRGRLKNCSNCSKVDNSIDQINY